MLIINKPRLPPIHLNRPTAAFEPDSAAPRLVLRLQWACFGGLVGRLGLLMIQYHITASLHHTSIHYGSGQQWTQYNIVTITQRHLHLQPDTRDGELSLCGYPARVLRCCCGV